jgi:phthiocerol/phenolphthiocerol synthesis type-I polyketide synthase E
VSREVHPTLTPDETRIDSPRWQDSVAIIGMGARFPGCPSVDKYWEQLAAGRNLLSEASDAELRSVGVDPDSAEAMHFVRSGTLLEGAESFDAKFFELTRREAEIMDPQQRIFLECAYEALEHAGMTGDGMRTGVFAGTGMNTYLMQLLGNPELLASAGGYQLMLGNDKDFLATRVAYKLNLRGPAVVIQTACSTSLAAVHLACQSLLSGECDSALAGGVSVMFPQIAGYPYIPGMILSPDGFCRPFDERARGTVPGKGAGVVVLKRLTDAVAAGDTIYAVIAGSAWNNDGSGKVGYTAPSVEGQAAVIRAAHAAAGINPDRIGYVEAHGTGTELGDPIEVAALAEAFGQRRSDAARCVLGSVKANMGHADVAAGVAGLIKAALAVHHGIIPPTPHFERANPELAIERTPFRVSAEAAEWPHSDTERWAGVSSFGIGGTNVHVCLRSAPIVQADPEAGSTVQGPWVFPLSAKTVSTLEASTTRLADFTRSSANLPLDAVAATLQSGRRVYARRRAVLAESAEELEAALRKPVKAASSGSGREAGKTAFLLPGQGLQFSGMAAALYATDRKFSEWIDRGLELLSDPLAGELHTAICDPSSTEAGNEPGAMQTSAAQPLLFLVEYALAKRWMDLGVQPGLLLGHSLGELTAAAIAGVFTFEDGLRLAAERGRLMQDTQEGAMLAVTLSVEDVGPYLKEDLWVAAENGPKLTVISGAVAAVEEAERRFAASRVAAMRLRTNRAFHTPHMAEAATRFSAAVAAVERHAPAMTWLSNVSGTWITPEEAIRPQYWADHITSRVRFTENAAILAKRDYFLLEVGPGDALAGLVRQHDRSRTSSSSLGAANRRGDDLRAFLESAARIWEHGTDLQWGKLPRRGNSRPRKIALPTYPFERERYWVETTHAPGAASARSTDTVAAPSAREKRSDIASWFYSPTWQRTPPAVLMLPRRSEPIATWLILDDQHGFGTHLADRLAHGGAEIIHLPANAVSRAQLESFWKEHRELISVAPIGLICCWTLRGTEIDLYPSLLLLLQTAQTARVRFAQMEFLADELVEVNGEHVADSMRAVAEGLARILPAEFAGVPVRVTDPGCLETGEFHETAVSRPTPEMLVAEFGTVPTSGLTVAYRGRTRWQEVWQPVRLEATGASKLRAGGTYVITGGMGGIGYLLTKHLLSKYGAKVALLGRTVLPVREQWEEWLTEHGPADAVSKRIQRARELEQLGGEVCLLSADVADQAAMENAWTVIEQKFGPVNGVIHAAGLPGGARIAAQDPASAEEVLRPKVQGSQVLVKLLAGRKIDFLLFCSSISAVVPVAGASAYTAANAFQDRYATWCRQHAGLPALSVNFDAWQEVGMAAELVISSAFEEAQAARLRLAMSPEEGIEALERALAAGETQMLISTRDFPVLLRSTLQGLNPRTVSTPEKTDSARISGDTDLVGGTESLETQAVIAIWKELLGAESIEADDNFFELGGHSLLGTMVLARIRERFGTELSIRAIFEAATPEALGNRIRKAGPGESAMEMVTVPGEREEFEI